jgi:hypothetical protein
MRLEPLSNILKQLRMEMKDKGECHFYFTLPLITRVGEMEGVGTFLNNTSKAKIPLSAHQNTSSPMVF